MAFGFFKKKMAEQGYYIIADYARRKGVSRQTIHKLVKQNQLPVIKQYGWKWIKDDFLQEEHSPLYPFLLFGFAKISQNIVSGVLTCDIKHFHGDRVVIKFHSPNGGVITIDGFLNTIQTFEK